MQVAEIVNISWSILVDSIIFVIPLLKKPWNTWKFFALILHVPMQWKIVSVPWYPWWVIKNDWISVWHGQTPGNGVCVVLACPNTLDHARAPEAIKAHHANPCPQDGPFGQSFPTWHLEFLSLQCIYLLQCVTALKCSWSLHNKSQMFFSLWYIIHLMPLSWYIICMHFLLLRKDFGGNRLQISTLP